MKKLLLFLTITFGSLFISIEINAQDTEFDTLLRQQVENINLVYKPVVGFGAGVINYFGEIKNNLYSPTIGSIGYNVNLATYIDKGHFIRGNFFFIGGKLTGNKRSTTNLSENFNFQTDIYAFGINLNYDFDHLYKKRYGFVQPFISLGIETFLFSSKTDRFGSYFNAETGRVTDVEYNYWTDGTIRSIPQSEISTSFDHLMKRDYTFETPIKEIEWGLGDYPEYAFSVPFEIGLDMHISNRLTLRISNSFHFTFTDNIDHVSSKNTSGIIGDRMNDMFNYTSISIHLDLFSSKKILTLERFFRDMDYDYTMFYGDEDVDGIFDGWDNCPGTPAGASVDSLGCPLDTDGDGVSDYMDDEMSTRLGAFVNDRGVEITEDDLAALLDKSMAVGRNEIDLYIRTPESYAQRSRSKIPVPQKFKMVDADKDGYISFDEMLQEINKFFDFESRLNASEIYELNNFFFAQ